MSREQELEAYSAFKGHHKPSKETVNFMENTSKQINKLEINFMKMETDIKYIKQGIDDLKGYHDINEEKIKEAEEEINELNGWRKYITGGLTILSLIVIPIGIYVIQQFLANQFNNKIITDEIRQQVLRELERNYDIQIIK